MKVLLHIITSLFLLIGSIAHAQKLKKIKVDDYDCFCKREYTVLKKQTEIKHGRYRVTHVEGYPISDGYYKMDKKDSLWTYYNRHKATISSQGYYTNDTKVGVWKYFNTKDELQHAFNHSTKALHYTTFIDTVMFRSIVLKDTIIQDKVDRAPIFLLGKSVQNRIIGENISYPQEAIAKNIFGTVNVFFVIDEFGEAKDHHVKDTLGGGCDQEALRVVKLIPDEWVPAVYKGKLAECEISIPITFVLN